MTAPDLRPVIAALAEAMGYRTEHECWGCGATVAHVAGKGRGKGLCRRCYRRWQQRGFDGNGPCYRALPIAERLEDYGHIITTRSAAQAAAEIGVCANTITRWRRALRQAS